MAVDGQLQQQGFVSSKGATYSLTHRACLRFFLHIQRQCIRLTVLHDERLTTHDGVLIAPTHAGHLEPFFISLRRRTPIHWMVRTEFYRYQLSKWMLNRMFTIPLNRKAVRVSSMRRAIKLLEQRETVGIFPEGRVAQGDASVMRGGPMKGGVCMLSLWAQAPVIPVAIVGTESLIGIRPWIPFRRGEVWINIGKPIAPPHDVTISTRRAARHEMMDQLRAAYLELRNELDEAMHSQ